MDTINQLAAVFYLHTYHCPTATPLKWPARSNALLAKSEQKHSVIANLENVILTLPRSFPEITAFLARGFNDEINLQINFPATAPIRIFIGVLMLQLIFPSKIFLPALLRFHVIISKLYVQFFFYKHFLNSANNFFFSKYKRKR